MLFRSAYLNRQYITIGLVGIVIFVLIWINGSNRPISYLRVLSEPEGVRIGRVATRAESRGQGLATELLRYVVDSTKGKLTLHAQAHLSDWYTSLGYVVTGEEFDDGDGIPHVPMTFVR